MPDTQQQTLLILFSMCITSSNLIGLQLRSLWVIFISWFTCCKTEEFGVGKKNKSKRWISALCCHWGNSLSLVPRYSSTLGAARRLLRRGFFGFVCCCWRNDGTKAFVSWEQLGDYIKRYHFEILFPSERGLLLTPSFSDCISAAPFQDWLTYQQQGERLPSPLGAQPTDTKLERDRWCSFLACHHWEVSHGSHSTPVKTHVVFLIALSALLVQPQSLKSFAWVQGMGTPSKQSKWNQIYSLFFCVSFKEWWKTCLFPEASQCELQYLETAGMLSKRLFMNCPLCVV